MAAFASTERVQWRGRNSNILRRPLAINLVMSKTYSDRRFESQVDCKRVPTLPPRFLN